MKITEIKFSISGEISNYSQGSPAVFVRLSGCNLAQKPCNFCDTKYALDTTNVAYNEPVHSIVERLVQMCNKNRVVVITGGEPLLQSYGVIQLIVELKYSGFHNLVVETNGTYNARNILPDVSGLCVVADYKPPSSGNWNLMNLDNFASFKKDDVIKFPIKTNEDFEKAVMAKHLIERKGCDCMKAVSPIFNNDKTIAREAYDVLGHATQEGFIVSVQLHKLINVY